MAGWWLFNVNHLGAGRFGTSCKIDGFDVVVFVVNGVVGPPAFFVRFPVKHDAGITVNGGVGLEVGDGGGAPFIDLPPR